MHVPARLLEAGADAARLSRPEVDHQVAECLRMCLRAYHGEFDPAKISQRVVGRSPDEAPVYQRLNRLLQPGTLREFIGRHPEFAWRVKDPATNKGMIVTWALSGHSAPGIASARATSEQPSSSAGPSAAPPPPDPAAPATGIASVSAAPAGASRELELILQRIIAADKKLDDTFRGHPFMPAASWLSGIPREGAAPPLRQSGTASGCSVPAAGAAEEIDWVARLGDDRQLRNKMPNPFRELS